eukprot:TRINITY_DN16403_c0_g1_i1.p1 TRINITY_DN16403_c0_g1~~TRINITY_DN16403_c0_g1_i1.p1  ORF type:complete len:124 (-),score=10.50 TRINITY_DN16403_c0_g1_i1:199-570(-)
MASKSIAIYTNEYQLLTNDAPSSGLAKQADEADLEKCSMDGVSANSVEGTSTDSLDVGLVIRMVVFMLTYAVGAIALLLMVAIEFLVYVFASRCGVDDDRDADDKTARCGTDNRDSHPRLDIT